MTVFVLSLGLTGDSKAGFVYIILNVLKKRKRISPGPKHFVFSLFFFFLKAPQSLTETRWSKVFKVLSEIQARSIFSSVTFRSLTLRCFKFTVRATTQQSQRFEKKERNKSGFFLHRYLNHSQLIKLDPPHFDFDFCSCRLVPRGFP